MITGLVPEEDTVSVSEVLMVDCEVALIAMDVSPGTIVSEPCAVVITEVELSIDTELSPLTMFPVVAWTVVVVGA